MRPPLRLVATDALAGFDYSRLEPAVAEDARNAAAQINQLERTHAIEVGRLLISIKAQLNFGLFQQWIADEFGMSLRSAERRMAEARLVDKNDKLSALPLALLRAIVRAPEHMQDDLAHQAVAGQIATACDVQKQVDRLAEQASRDAYRAREEARGEFLDRLHDNFALNRKADALAAYSTPAREARERAVSKREKIKSETIEREEKARAAAVLLLDLIGAEHLRAVVDAYDEHDYRLFDAARELI